MNQRKIQWKHQKTTTCKIKIRHELEKKYESQKKYEEKRNCKITTEDKSKKNSEEGCRVQVQLWFAGK